MFGDFSCCEVDGAHLELYLPEKIASLADELARWCAQALHRSRPFSPLKACAFEFAVSQTPTRALPGARLALEISLRNVGQAAIGGEHANLRIGGSWTRRGAEAGARFIDARALPALAPGDATVVEIFPSAPDNEGIFELALDLFEERGHSLTALGAAPSPRIRLKVTRRATPIRESLRTLFQPGERDRRPNA
jgi:hypothetical protein